MEQHRSEHDRQIVIVPKENDQDQILKRKTEKNINAESFVNEKKERIIIEKIESNIKEVERKEKERKHTYEEVQKNKSCKRKEEERKKETIEEKDLFENMEDKTKKFQKERKEKRKRFFFQSTNY